MFAFRVQGRLALRSNVQNSLLFGTWLLSGSRASVSEAKNWRMSSCSPAATRRSRYAKLLSDAERVGAASTKEMRTSVWVRVVSA